MRTLFQEIKNFFLIKEQGEQLATENGCHFFECSAKEDINVADVFTRLSEEIIRHMPIEQHRPNTRPLQTTYLSDNNNNKPPTARVFEIKS